MTEYQDVSRRHFLEASVAAGVDLAGTVASTAAGGSAQPVAGSDRALIAITLDLEMSRNFPTWEQTHWDYDKGNLNDETKRYTVEACRRVRGHGGVLHCFMLGRTLEQENVDWLQQILRAGHPIGNHTYDHVNITATRPQDIQFRFQRAPWLMAGQTPRQVIVENIRMTSAAMQSRLGVRAAGFRTPGGFASGLADRPDLQQMVRDLGFSWVSSKYPAHRMSSPPAEPGREVFDSIVQAQAAAQPFTYPRGLVEIPMSPVSDIGAFRNGRWNLDAFLRAVRLAVEWTIEHRAVFDFLGHPSCLYVTDPQFRTIELISRLVREAGNRAAIVSLEDIARLRPGRHLPAR
jgi:peptidoglycan/xylan/chitin deacetylase (PgdA/CDA1 family)